jgi:hypothetical protein
MEMLTVLDIPEMNGCIFSSTDEGLPIWAKADGMDTTGISL